MQAIVHNDEPTSQDRLNRDQYAEALARLAESCDTPLVIGLYGTWGMGKTSLMKLIEGKLDEAKSLPIWFDPWQHQFDENPVVALAHTMVDRMAEPGWKEEGEKLLSVIATALTAAFMKATTGLKAKEVMELARLYEDERFQVREARVRLKEYFGELVQKARGPGPKPKRLVFFIDDLDRCVPEEPCSRASSIAIRNWTSGKLTIWTRSFNCPLTFPPSSPKIWRVSWSPSYLKT